MLYVKALKEGVVGPDWQGVTKTFRLDEASLIKDSDKGYYETRPEVFEIIVVPDVSTGQGSTVLPKRTGKPKWTNIANGVNYPNQNGLGGRENIFRFVLYVRDAVKAGQLGRFKVSARADYAEGNAGVPNNRNLNGTKMQIALEWPLQADDLTPCYPDDNGFITTHTFGTEAFKEFYYRPTTDIPEDSHIHGWCFAQGRVPVSAGSLTQAMRNLTFTDPVSITATTPASAYIGDLSNSKLQVNGAWALFSDSGFTAMSAATRKALTPVVDNATLGGALLHFVPFSMETITDRQCGVSISDSTDQTGGSGASAKYDYTLCSGLSGAFFELEHPCLKLSSANDGMKYWAPNPSEIGASQYAPTYNEFRRSQIQFGTFIFEGLVKNDVGAFASPGTEVGIIKLRNNFKQLPELQGYPRVGYTLPPFSTSLSTDLESTPLSAGGNINPARILYNNAVLQDNDLLHVFKLDELLRNPANTNQLRPYRFLRTVTGSTNGNILTLDAGNFFFPYFDAGQNIGSLDWGGSGVASFSSQHRIIAENKAWFPSNFATNLPSGTQFVVGSCLYTAGLTDKVHYNGIVYRLARDTIGWGGRDAKTYSPFQLAFGLTQ